MQNVTKCKTMDERNDTIARYNSKGLKVWSKYFKNYDVRPLETYWVVAGAATVKEAQKLTETASFS